MGRRGTLRRRLPRCREGVPLGWGIRPRARREQRLKRFAAFRHVRCCGWRANNLLVCSYDSGWNTQSSHARPVRGEAFAASKSSCVRPKARPVTITELGPFGAIRNALDIVHQIVGRTVGVPADRKMAQLRARRRLQPLGGWCSRSAGSLSSLQWR